MDAKLLPQQLDNLKCYLLVFHGVPPELADSLQLTVVRHNKIGSVTFSFVADDLTNAVEKTD